LLRLGFCCGIGCYLHCFRVQAQLYQVCNRRLKEFNLQILSRIILKCYLAPRSTVDATTISGHDNLLDEHIEKNVTWKFGLEIQIKNTAIDGWKNSCEEFCSL